MYPANIVVEYVLNRLKLASHAVNIYILHRPLGYFLRGRGLGDKAVLKRDLSYSLRTENKSTHSFPRKSDALTFSSQNPKYSLHKNFVLFPNPS